MLKELWLRGLPCDVEEGSEDREDHLCGIVINTRRGLVSGAKESVVINKQSKTFALLRRSVLVSWR